MAENSIGCDCFWFNEDSTVVPREQNRAIKTIRDEQSHTITSDTYAVLCDMNCHRWIATIISYSVIYPPLELPSKRHFQLASVHDLNNVDKSRVADNASCFHWFWCTHCSSESSFSSQPSHLMAPTNHHHIFQSSNPLSSVSVISANNNDQQINVDPKNASLIMMNVEYDIAVHYCNDDLEITSDCSGTSIEQQYRLRQPRTHHETYRLASKETKSEYSSFSTSTTIKKWFSISSFQSWKCYLVNLLFIIATLRYVVHLAWVVFGQNRNRIILYRYCPLIVAMFESLTSMITTLIIYCHRSPLEELIISIASFFRPLSYWKRVFLVQMVTILYLISNLVFMVINCGPWFPNITSMDSTWHRYRRSYSDLLPLLPTITQQWPQRLTTTQNSANMLNEPSPMSTTQFEPEWNWNYSSAIPWQDLDYFITVTNRTTNGHVDNQKMSRLLRFSPTPTPTFINVTVGKNIKTGLINTSTTGQLLYYFDFLVYLLNTYSLILMKAFHLGIAMLFILKCWQLYTEIRKHELKLKQLSPNSNLDKRAPASKMRICDENTKLKSMVSDSWQKYQQSETERLTILTRVLMGNIRSYEDIFGNLLVIWLALSLTTVLAIVEFYFCPHNSQAENNNQFEPMLRWAAVTIHGQDFLLLLFSYLIIHFIRRQCLLLINQ